MSSGLRLPESLKPARGYISQIQRRRPSATHSMGTQGELVVEVNIRVRMPLSARKSGR